MHKFLYITFVLLYCVSASADDGIENKTMSIRSMEYPNTLHLLKREEWGWTEGIQEKTQRNHQVYALTIHHGGVVAQQNMNSLEHVKNLLKWSRAEKNWIDIPYHYMIDPKGLIYETRPVNIPGDTNTEYDPTGHILVELMGNFEQQQVSELQMNSLVQLSQFLVQKFNITAENIKTHRDYSNQTVCPGKNLYQFFENGRFNKMLELNSD